MLGLRRKMKTMVKSVLGLDDNAEQSSVDWTVPAHQPAAEPQNFEASSVNADEMKEDEMKEDEMKEDVEPESSIPTETSQTDSTADAGEGLELTMENVLEVVDEYIRPGLMSDGGDITIIKIENNNVYVQLTGACQSCSSSIMTMKMGVEALLKEEFPTLNEVIDQTEYSVESMDF